MSSIVMFFSFSAIPFRHPELSLALRVIVWFPTACCVALRIICPWLFTCAFSPGGVITSYVIVSLSGSVAFISQVILLSCILVDWFIIVGQFSELIVGGSVTHKKTWLSLASPVSVPALQISVPVSKRFIRKNDIIRAVIILFISHQFY